MVQSGDFQFNNGDGGESVYGGTFNDEDFSRRHTQGGILSMANKGRNSNGSQFFITLRRHAMLDGKHIAFGQVIAGMDVIRAIGQVPVDRDEKPRVAVTIVGSGEVGRATKSPANIHAQLEKHIGDLNEEIAPTGAKVPEAVKAKAILAGKQGGAAVESATPAGKAGGKEDEAEEDEEGTATAPARNERERRLMELRLKMNACRTSNSKEVVEEQKRAADPEYAMRQARAQKKREREEKEQKEEEEGGGAGQGKGVPRGKEYLLDTVETVEMKDAKKKKGNPDAFGWDVFNQDSLLRAHEKRLKHIQHDGKAYLEQKQEEEAKSSVFAGFGHKPTEEAKDRLQNAMEKVMEKKKEFSRRRAYCEEEDVTYINERNRHFNKKMQRYFGSYTEEIRQNLERGTAL
uniref:PPIase cyclophilin-type domain-containing protein n=1 Tax=Alexandrium catenella TaxID=2925 RepID=A0A7S1SCA6_ALECA